MEWISTKNNEVSRKIPVLVHAGFLDFPVAIHWKEDGTYGKPGFFEHGDEYSIREEDITHWMSLPEPPKNSDG